jgi:hypothetical protein
VAAKDRADTTGELDRVAEIDKREKALARSERELLRREWIADEQDRIAGASINRHSANKPLPVGKTPRSGVRWPKPDDVSTADRRGSKSWSSAATSSPIELRI